MKVTTITARYARRFNLANYGGPQYEWIEPEVLLSAELEEGEDYDAAVAELNEIAKASVKAQAAPVLAHYLKQVEAVRNGLPADVQAALED